MDTLKSPVLSSKARVSQLLDSQAVKWCSSTCLSNLPSFSKVGITIGWQPLRGNPTSQRSGDKPKSWQPGNSVWGFLPGWFSDPSWLDQGSTSEHFRLLGPLDFDQLEACGCVDHGRELNSSFKFVAARMAGQNMSPFVSLASALIFLDRSKQMQGRKCVRDNPPYVPKLLRLLCSLHDISVFGRHKPVQHSYVKSSSRWPAFHRCLGG